MFTYIDWLAHLEHHKDLLREAEQERLARLAVSAHPVRKIKKKARLDPNNRSKSTEIVCCASGIA
jgi:hypothetical protein